MKHHAMERCELKHPYEQKIYWKNKVDFDFSFNPLEEKVLIEVTENNSDYRVTKIQVKGTYLACENIPKEPSKLDHSSWSSPVEIKFTKGIGEIDLENFGPHNSVLDAVNWNKGPECMNYLDVHGIRFK